MYHVPSALQCINGRSDEEDENGDGKEGREWRLPGLLYADDMVLCGVSENLRAMLGRFVEVCRRGGLKVNAGVLQWFGYAERMESDRIAKSLCRRVCW